MTPSEHTFRGVIEGRSELQGSKSCKRRRRQIVSKKRNAPAPAKAEILDVKIKDIKKLREAMQKLGRTLAKGKEASPRA